MKSIWFKMIPFLLILSCVHTEIRRTGRHERSIKITASAAAYKHRLHRHLKRRSELLNCDELIIKEIVDGSHITATCITTP